MVETVFKITLIAIIIAIAIGVLGTISFGWNLNTSQYLKGLTSFLQVIFYVVPIAKLSPLLVCFVGLMAFRVVVSLIKTIWNLIPIAQVNYGIFRIWRCIYLVYILLLFIQFLAFCIFETYRIFNKRYKLYRLEK